jgi:hypothetical protein
MFRRSVSKLSGPLRIAAFGFRSFPPRRGSAGADKFAFELLPRLAARGHEVTAYARGYTGEDIPPPHQYMGVNVIRHRIFRRSGAEASEFVRLLGLESRITLVNVGSDKFEKEYFAPRPKSEKLENLKLRARGIDFMPHWKDARADYVQEFNEDLGV